MSSNGTCSSLIPPLGDATLKIPLVVWIRKTVPCEGQLEASIARRSEEALLHQIRSPETGRSMPSARVSTASVSSLGKRCRVDPLEAAPRERQRLGDNPARHTTQLNSGHIAVMQIRVVGGFE